ncbi:helix-turn-helix domain-containing protein [Chelativorans sp. AA-79]|uniref:helix-turn-helix domain-containing protein n=1 Tax=Chelativorans sp. AA-79 TaxID=3028735 RepID=UPI0023F6EB8A|nr:helix-turn-helix domain-containing protein [Chelativorans sp. AA-79]WEX12439.1 helix-turn-helix domain-containing protein [Chelativorans sp. AA-79]
MRHARYRRRPTDDVGRRIRGFLEGIETGARRGMEDLQKVTLARDVMLRRCEGRRKSSKLPKLVALFVKRPLVSVPMAAKTLKVSPQAIERMLDELGGALPRELTGRGRFRAWGIL